MKKLHSVFSTCPTESAPKTLQTITIEILRLLVNDAQ